MGGCARVFEVSGVYHHRGAVVVFGVGFDWEVGDEDAGVQVGVVFDGVVFGLYGDPAGGGDRAALYLLVDGVGEVGGVVRGGVDRDRECDGVFVVGGEVVGAGVCGGYAGDLRVFGVGVVACGWEGVRVL